MKKAAGILVYRHRPHGCDVFLVHPGGPFWARKDTHAWSMPKGEFTDEDPLVAARREFEEETGQVIEGHAVALTPIRASGKLIHAFAIQSEAPEPANIRSNTFELEWPPRSGRIQSFPEVDRAAWFALDEARLKIHKGQVPLLDQLGALLNRE